MHHFNAFRSVVFVKIIKGFFPLFFLFLASSELYREEAAAKAKAKAAAEKVRLANLKKANAAKYNALNKTVGGSSKLIKKSAPISIKDPFAGRKKEEKKSGGGLFGMASFCSFISYFTQNQVV